MTTDGPGAGATIIGDVDPAATADAARGLRRAWLEVAGVTAGLLAIVVAAAMLQDGVPRLVRQLVAYALIVALVLAMRPGADLLGYSRERIGRQALVGLGTAAGLLLVVVGLPVALGADAKDVVGSDSAVVTMVMAILVVGPVEELAFRGYLLGRLRQLVSPWWAAAISSAVFGVWHFPVNGDLLQVGVTACIGFALAAVRLKVPHGTTAAVGLGHGLYDAALRLVARLAG